MTYRKKLIEVALPLMAINKASKREKSIRHGHPSNLHRWWARRPLAAARAVIFAQMVDDPSAHPDIFKTEKEQEMERQLQVERAGLQQACQAARNAAEQLAQLQAGMVAEAEEQLAALAVEIARKVLMREIRTGRHEIDPIVTEALQHITQRLLPDAALGSQLRHREPVLTVAHDAVGEECGDLGGGVFAVVVISHW